MPVHGRERERAAEGSLLCPPRVQEGGLLRAGNPPTTHADSGRTVFFSSATAGSVLAAAASNLYFPAQDRGVGPSVHRLVIDFADTALFNVAAEFWPDITQKLGRVLPKP